MPLKRIVRQRWTYGAVIFVVVKFNSSGGFLERFPLRALQTCVEPSRVAERTLSAKLASGRCLFILVLSDTAILASYLAELILKASDAAMLAISATSNVGVRSNAAFDAARRRARGLEPADAARGTDGVVRGGTNHVFATRAGAAVAFSRRTHIVCHVDAVPARDVRPCNA